MVAVISDEDWENKSFYPNLINVVIAIAIVIITTVFQCCTGSTRVPQAIDNNMSIRFPEKEYRAALNFLIRHLLFHTPPA